MENSRATLQAVVEFSKNSFFSSNQVIFEEQEPIDTLALVIQKLGILGIIHKWLHTNLGFFYPLSLHHSENLQDWRVSIYKWGQGVLPPRISKCVFPVSFKVFTLNGFRFKNSKDNLLDF